jgi:uncharacterized membrane protein YsdA (DUF1294 family)/cold shock CspA family protein
MRYVGSIVEWNDARGFGFVEPNGGGDRAFVHINAIRRVTPHPATGLRLSYALKKDERGRWNAVDVRPAVARRAADVPARSRPLPRGVAVAFAGALAIAWWMAKIPTVIVLAYAIASVVAFVFYWKDKVAAEHGHWRTPESTLQFVAFLGGWPGALFAQHAFRHKSAKASFQKAFIAMVVLNVVALGWLVASGRAAALQL